jgi:catechol 2,3-dioxygenase-like lactoylglutathione lyase family enzyme
MQPLGVHHVSINSADVPASIAFYTEILGFTIDPSRPDFGFPGAWLSAGAQQVHLLGSSAIPANLGQHFALHVADIEGSIAELRAKGIEVTDPSPVNDGFQAFLTDPDGNAIELFQRDPLPST